MVALPSATVQYVASSQSAPPAPAVRLGDTVESGADAKIAASTPQTLNSFADLLVKTNLDAAAPVKSQTLPVNTTASATTSKANPTDQQNDPHIFNVLQTGAFNIQTAKSTDKTIQSEVKPLSDALLKTEAGNVAAPEDINATLARLITFGQSKTKSVEATLSQPVIKSTARKNDKESGDTGKTNTSGINTQVDNSALATLSVVVPAQVATEKKSSSIDIKIIRSDKHITNVTKNEVNMNKNGSVTTDTENILKSFQPDKTTQPVAIPNAATAFDKLLNIDSKAMPHIQSASTQTTLATHNTTLLTQATPTTAHTSNIITLTPHMATMAHEVGLEIVKASQVGKTEFTIRLDPAELGRIEIKLHMDHDGKVQAVLSSDNPQTHDLLRREAGSLAKALTDSGLKTEGSALSFNLRDQNQNQRDNQYFRNTHSSDNSPATVFNTADGAPTKIVQLSLQNFLNDSRINVIA